MTHRSPTPGVFPRGGPVPTSSRAEQAFHRALTAGLPPDWFAWHSLRIRTATNLEGEGDFVIAIPDRGVLVIEVKGGSIEKRNGVWIQNGRAMERAPREQAHEYVNKLLHKLRERCEDGAPWIAVATAFPDTPFANEPTQGDMQGAVLGQQDLAYLREALVELAARLFNKARMPRNTLWISALHDLWCETWTPGLTLGARARLREAELIALDDDQLALLDYIEENPRMLVKGGPGTGKTLLAREMYLRLARHGKHPVLLCSTKALAAGLRADGLTDAWTVGELAASLLDRAQIPMQNGSPPAQWTAETWELASLQAAVDALPAVGTPYQSIIVDEAQDLSTGDWDLVNAVAGTNVIWAFSDDAQGFWDNRFLPPELFPAHFTLKSRYRCPESLALFADQYRPRAHGAAEVPVSPFDELRLVRAPTAKMIQERAANEIQKALSRGASRSDIAVLSLAGQTRTQLCSTKKIGTFDVVRADDVVANQNIIADTFLRFKGLERPWIIVAELSLGAKKYVTRMHVALTRATLGCVVVATPEEIAEDEFLAQLDV